MTTFGERLRKLRKHKKLTMKELGQKLGIATSTVAGHEKNERTPDVETTKKYADFFGVSVDDLLGRELSEEQKAFLSDLDLELTNEELMRKYSLTIDGEEATEEEIEVMLSVVRALRTKRK